MEDETGGLLNIDIASDDEATTDYKKVPRDFQSEGNFQSVKAGYIAKIENGEVSMTLCSHRSSCNLSHRIKPDVTDGTCSCGRHSACLSTTQRKRSAKALCMQLKNSTFPNVTKKLRSLLKRL